MKKQKGQLLLLLRIMVAAFAAYAAVSLYQKKHAEDQAEETEKYTVTDFEAQDVMEIKYTNDTGTYSFVKSEEVSTDEEDKITTTWNSKEEPENDVSETTVDAMITYIAHITSAYKIENVADFSVYGLENPSRTVDVTLKDKNLTLKFGDYNELTGYYYLSVNDEKSVYSVGTDIYGTFEKTLEDFKETKDS